MPCNESQPSKSMERLAPIAPIGDDEPLQGYNWSYLWTDEWNEAQAIDFVFTNSVASTGADLTIENLLAAQEELRRR